MKNTVKTIFTKSWRALDASRKVAVNLLFVAIVAGLVALALALAGGGPDVPKRTALVLAPSGDLVEQLDGDPMGRAIAELTGDSEPQTLLRDLLDAIAAAKDDKRVEVLLLDLNRMGGAGLTKLQDLKAAVEDFKTSGKPVIATADAYSQGPYYLAALADEIYMHEDGLLILEGFSRFRTFYKDGIDRLEIDWNVFRVGEYKSAVEPFLRNDMSEEAKLADREWLGDLWQTYLEQVAAARQIDKATIQDYIDGFARHLGEHQGDSAQMALAAGLIDHAATRDQVRDRLIELVGEDEDTHSFHQIAHPAYLEALGDDRPSTKGKGDAIGVIVARGTILDGTQPPGKIGGDSTAALIRQARNDEKIKAVVLRVDSGGGSGFASEVIRRELQLTREAGKPVVASMGSVAASGGYWITMAADEVWAYPTTITGSIGIFGMFPTFQKPLAKYLGMHVDGVGTTTMAGALRADRALQPELAEAIQLIVDEGYRDFITKAAESRGMTPEQIDPIARGRVWSGMDALDLKLVDNLGGLDQALAAAARLANLGEEYRVTYVEKELGFKEKLAHSLLSRARAWLGPDMPADPSHDAYTRVVEQIREQAETLAELNDPNGLYAHCLCEYE